MILLSKKAVQDLDCKVTSYLVTTNVQGWIKQVDKSASNKRGLSFPRQEANTNQRGNAWVTFAVFKQGVDDTNTLHTFFSLSPSIWENLS